MSVSSGKLQIESGDGAKATCESLTIPVEGSAAVELSVKGKHIHVCAGASECGTGRCSPRSVPQDSLVGKALQVSRSGPQGCVLNLEGEVTLSLVRKGKKADLTAERISVNLLTGLLEAQVGHPPQFGSPGRPVPPVSARTAATVPAPTPSPAPPTTCP